eukprot:12097554-Ditylum_brightwellii.AAC.1
MKNKCTVLTIKHGKSKSTDILPDIPRLGEDHRYCYLGVYKDVDFLTDHMKKVHTHSKWVLAPKINTVTKEAVA